MLPNQVYYSLSAMNSLAKKVRFTSIFRGGLALRGRTRNCHPILWSWKMECQVGGTGDRSSPTLTCVKQPSLQDHTLASPWAPQNLSHHPYYINSKRYLATYAPEDSRILAYKLSNNSKVYVYDKHQFQRSKPLSPTQCHFSWRYQAWRDSWRVCPEWAYKRGKLSWHPRNFTCHWGPCTCSREGVSHIVSRTGMPLQTGVYDIYCDCMVPDNQNLPSGQVPQKASDILWCRPWAWHTCIEKCLGIIVIQGGWKILWTRKQKTSKVIYTAKTEH